MAEVNEKENIFACVCVTVCVTGLLDKDLINVGDAAHRFSSAIESRNLIVSTLTLNKV